MSDAKLHAILDTMLVPREVWIGTDSPADRLEWLKRRKEMQSILVTDGNFTYVSIDDQGHPQAVQRQEPLIIS